MMSRLILAGLLTAATAATMLAQDQPPSKREFTIVGEDFRFSPDRIEVAKDDLVKVTLQSTDHAYTFAIDEYRIVKRAGGGQTISFEFRADQPGTFAFYCNMSADPRCKDMRGTLVVKKAR
jgi:heme/copper-type cytochrome/quinol oxidase subunit 2